MAAFRRASKTLECSSARCDFHFCKAIAHQAIRSVVERTESGGGCIYDASTMSNGRSG